jgi:uncharacterized glyoxalase superfamily protein PhnB
LKLRLARHTNQLQKIKSFYIDVLGFELIGEFNDHDNYNGIFLSKDNSEWHLEFTESSIQAKHEFDEDDLMVFYADSIKELNLIKRNLTNKGVNKIKAQNPYWNRNGFMLKDPDGYRIVFSVRNVH